VRRERGNFDVLGILRNVEIQISPSLGDDAFRMLASGARRVKPPDKNSWRAKYKRLSRLETDYSLILDDFEKNLARLIKDKEAQAVVVFRDGKES